MLGRIKKIEGLSCWAEFKKIEGQGFVSNIVSNIHLEQVQSILTFLFQMGTKTKTQTKTKNKQQKKQTNSYSSL